MGYFDGYSPGEKEHFRYCADEGGNYTLVRGDQEVIEKPDHYTHGEREAIDYMRDIGVLEQYCVGNIFKYLYRYKHKNNPTEDLLKARQYIDILVKELESKNG